MANLETAKQYYEPVTPQQRRRELSEIAAFWQSRNPNSRVTLTNSFSSSEIIIHKKGPSIEGSRESGKTKEDVNGTSVPKGVETELALLMSAGAPIVLESGTPWCNSVTKTGIRKGPGRYKKGS